LEGYGKFYPSVETPLSVHWCKRITAFGTGGMILRIVRKGSDLIERGKGLLLRRETYVQH
jgi:hypothetical protein